MKCPYAVNRFRRTSTQIEYNEDGQQSEWTETEFTSAIFINCLREQCGAYNKSKQKCEYRVAVNQQ